MINPELIQLIQHDRKFQEIAIPLGPEASINNAKDAEFLVRNDGIIFNVEGYYHPTDFLVGEVLYAPDTDGDKKIFGQPYRKITLQDVSWSSNEQTRRTRFSKDRERKII